MKLPKSLKGAAVALSVIFGTHAANAAIPQPIDLADVVDKVMPSTALVLIKEPVVDKNGVAQLDENGEPQLKTDGLGSGFIYRSVQEGDHYVNYIITNNHVAGDAKNLNVVLGAESKDEDPTEYPATLINGEPDVDIAVIKIETDKPLQPVTFANSDALRIGSGIFAIGAPYGLDFTVTAGIVSQLGREGVLKNSPYDVFQTDAAINKGNSGGPSFNFEGKVVGMNTAIFTPDREGSSTGLGFAIPANEIEQLAAQIVDNEDHRVHWGSLGIKMAPVNENDANEAGLEETTGIKVVGVKPNSPAQAAGLESGDIILSLNGDEVSNTDRFAKDIKKLFSGTQISITYSSDHQTHTATTVLDLLPPLPKAPTEAPEVSVPDPTPDAPSTTPPQAKPEVQPPTTDEIPAPVVPEAPANEGGAASHFPPGFLESAPDEVLDAMKSHGEQQLSALEKALGELNAEIARRQALETQQAPTPQQPPAGAMPSLPPLVPVIPPPPPLPGITSLGPAPARIPAPAPAP